MIFIICDDFARCVAFQFLYIIYLSPLPLFVSGVEESAQATSSATLRTDKLTIYPPLPLDCVMCHLSGGCVDHVKSGLLLQCDTCKIAVHNYCLPVSSSCGGLMFVYDVCNL